MVFVSLFSCRLDSAQLQQLKPFLIKIMLLKTKIKIWVLFTFLLGCFKVLRLLWVSGVYIYIYINFRLEFSFSGDPKALEWKKWNSKELGISNSTISRPTKKVLDGLKKNGSSFVRGGLFYIRGFFLVAMTWTFVVGDTYVYIRKSCCLLLILMMFVIVFCC